MATNQNVYSMLLSLGAPPEVIQRLMSQIQNGQSSLFQNKDVGMRGASLSPLTSTPGSVPPLPGIR